MRVWVSGEVRFYGGLVNVILCPLSFQDRLECALVDKRRPCCVMTHIYKANANSAKRAVLILIDVGQRLLNSSFVVFKKGLQITFMSHWIKDNYCWWLTEVQEWTNNRSMALFCTVCFYSHRFKRKRNSVYFRVTMLAFSVSIWI